MSNLKTAKFDTHPTDRKSTRLNSSHQIISYAVFCLKKKIFQARGSFFALTKSPKYNTDIVLCLRPHHRSALPCPYRERCLIRLECLLQQFSFPLTLSESPERSAETVLRDGPFKGYLVAVAHGQGRLIGSDGFFEPRGPPFTIAQISERVAQVILRCSPFERVALAWYEFQ